MGYRTYYNLIITHPNSVIEADMSDEEKEAIIDKIRKPDSDAWYAVDEEGQSRQDTSWDDVDEDMKAISQEYPELIFEVAGVGDESTDMWSTYYKNGKMQHCPVEIIYPPYDETKLV